ncbi:MAG: methyltransferase/corrinoid binding protein, partial [Chloroflexi bacterium]|nr:methyltransferase/corrinoid binding protein [Chloroflexota bacterium]
GAEAVVMHICGRALPLVPDVAALGCDVMDIDAPVDPAAALAASGRMALRGNIDPAGVLLYGTPELVEEKVRAALAAAGRQGRFILSSGCDVPPDTPPENIAALVRAARAAGRG